MKTKLLVIAILSMVALSGCEEQERAQALLAKPETSDVGIFDGCDVKFVNRGYDSQSFFMAKCDTTETQTTNYRKQSGKSTYAARTTTITQQIADLQAEKTKIQQDEDTRQAAMAKLSPAERAALGVGTPAGSQ